MEEESCRIVHVELPFKPLQLSLLPIDVLAVLETREDRVQVKEADAAPRNIVPVETLLKEFLFDRRELGVRSH
jgi:hypothetical protein